MEDARICSHCGASAPATLRFCEQCGQPLGEDSASTPAVESAAPSTTPWYRRPGWIALVVVVLAGGAVTVVLAAGGGDSPGVLFKTPDGTYRLEEVEYSERIPPDCTNPGSGPSCIGAKPGFKVLRVSFSGDELGFPDRDAYVVSGDGTRTKSFGSGVDYGEKRAYLLFTPRESERNFTLHWLDNPPTELDE